MAVRVVAQGVVAAANAAEFRQFIADATDLVRRKEQGRTLTYDFFTTESGDSNYLIHEVYMEGDDLVTHLQGLGELMTVIARVFKVERIILAGKLPRTLVEQFSALGPTYHYGETVSALQR